MEKKEAMKILKDFHDNSALFSIRTALETLHPELKESEDERIRKEILDCFIAMKQQGCFPSKHKEQYDSWIAWLKKQSEYKSQKEVLKIRQELYQSGYNDGYKHGCEDSKKQGEQKVEEIDEEYKIGKWFTGLIPCWINAPSTLQPEVWRMPLSARLPL